MFVNLVNKYGVVPKSAYPEAVGSSSSKTLNWLIRYKLREYAMKVCLSVSINLSSTASL